MAKKKYFDQLPGAQIPESLLNDKNAIKQYNMKP